MKKIIIVLLGLISSFSIAQAATLAEVLQASIDQGSQIELVCQQTSNGKQVTFNISAELVPATQLGEKPTYDQLLANPFIGGFSIKGDHVRNKQYGVDYEVKNGELFKLTFGKPQSPIHISSDPLMVESLFIKPSRTNRARIVTGYTYINCTTSID